MRALGLDELGELFCGEHFVGGVDGFGEAVGVEEHEVVGVEGESFDVDHAADVVHQADPHALDILAPHLGPDGLIVVDDGYLPDDSPHRQPLVVRRRELLGEIDAACMRLVEETVIGAEAMQAMDEAMFRDVERRCRELIACHPDKRDLFEGYIRRQVEENDWLESRIVCAVLAIRKR